MHQLVYYNKGEESTRGDWDGFLALKKDIGFYFLSSIREMDFTPGTRKIQIHKNCILFLLEDSIRTLIIFFKRGETP
jgi:hypothetical protein